MLRLPARLKERFADAKSKKLKVVLKLKFTVFLIFVVFFVTACLQTKSKRREIVIAESKSYEASIFRQNCAICHGQEANGKEMDGRIIPSLRYGAAAQKTEEEIYFQIKEGKSPMPGFKNQLTEDEIRRMVQFVRRDLQGKQGTKNEK
jgi:cytochrome c553